MFEFPSEEGDTRNLVTNEILWLKYIICEISFGKQKGWVNFEFFWSCMSFCMERKRIWNATIIRLSGKQGTFVSWWWCSKMSVFLFFVLIKNFRKFSKLVSLENKNAEWNLNMFFLNLHVILYARNVKHEMLVLISLVEDIKLSCLGDGIPKCQYFHFFFYCWFF